MIIKINKSILHIFDVSSGVTVYSQDILEESAHEFLYPHIEKSFQDGNAKSGQLPLTGVFASRLQAYNEGDLNFLEMSVALGKQICGLLAKTADLKSTDFVCCDVELDGEPYVVLFLMTNQQVYVHQVFQNGGTTTNQIIQHQAVLPGPTQRISDFVYVHRTQGNLRLSEKARKINEESLYLFQDRIIGCATELSTKESMKNLNKIVTDVASEYGENVVEAVFRAKTYVMDNVDVADVISPTEFGREVFAGSGQMQADFAERVREAELPETIAVPKEAAIKNSKTHRIKTDSGIEIIVPVDFFNNPDVIEFINNPDGTISIAIKNIEKLTNKS